MKTPIFLKTILAACFVAIACGSYAQNNSLKGRWLHVDDSNDSSAVEFKEKNIMSLYLIFMGAIDSSEFFLSGSGNEFEAADESTMLVDAKYKTSKTHKNHLYFVLYHAGTDKPYLILPLLYSLPAPNKLVLTLFDDYSDFEDGVLYTDESSWKKAEDILLNTNPQNVEDIEFVRW